MSHLDINIVPLYYQGYIKLVYDLELIESLETSLKKISLLIKALPEEKGEHRYHPAKWSIKESLCHVMDVERIFSYRALRFARNDQTPLPGFEDTDYALEANAHGRTLSQLITEMSHLRTSTIDLFRSFTPTMLDRKGTASNNEFSVLSIGYIIAGHETHHCNILLERYLKDLE